ncbi:MULTISPECIES: DUF411 domain-containing protein [Nitrobacteraceae]|jgi:hypothetical protein|uniref:Metal-binding protein n=1 Tax=Rhodopseudomonas palustris TaxID=1076 RepID=A0A0D7EVI0_RHOPL|nr:MULTISPECIES: DUF411 domain-containing protein [Nitrobacteraceae]MBY0381010.1 DUF411 domain-containing protein [Xanthobacteraceae bacterium]KIZ44788.1 metal-binding protein [Rhodopseudomonas palustris]KQW18037.1 metal-binding protein [Afipia sp. Root123D2]MDF3811353.1 DUF411 domain-containing protein [Rhodopseudomonas sp. BAL398]WOK20936.1 DUF411 domain-containing protein [Rhodopseudomonas sp. BAL398]
MNTGNLSRRSALGIVAVALIAPAVSDAAQSTIIRVHKDPSCGCCSGWVRHLESAGFSVAVQEERNLQGIRKHLSVPTDLAACHTAEAGGYVIEGHVPAAAIQRLLKERPVATGVAVPGMPVGSPGMEGGTPERYAVVLFGPGGRRAYMEFEGVRPVG